MPWSYPINGRFNEADTAMTNILQEVWLGNKKPKEAADEAYKTVQAIMDKDPPRRTRGAAPAGRLARRLLAPGLGRRYPCSRWRKAPRTMALATSRGCLPSSRCQVGDHLRGGEDRVDVCAHGRRLRIDSVRPIPDALVSLHRFRRVHGAGRRPNH